MIVEGKKRLQDDLSKLLVQYQTHREELCERVYELQKKFYNLGIELCDTKVQSEAHCIEMMQNVDQCCCIRRRY